MNTAVIVDDEAPVRNVISKLLAELCPEIEVTGQANSVKTAYPLIEDKRPDIVFLDVEMPGGSGFDLLDKFNDIFFQTIFITAHEDYAMKAIRFSALDYILKPVDPHELITAVKKVRHQQHDPQIMRSVIDRMKSPAGINSLAIASVKKTDFVSFDEIVHFLSEGSYTHIHLTSGKKILSSKPLQYYEDLLQGTVFFRVHRSHLINMSHVREYVRDQRDRIIMTDGSEIEIYRKKRKEFMDAVAKYNLLG